MKKEDTAEKINPVPVTLGLLAHVDAGKTTLAEGLLFCSGKLRAPGRVDHGDAFLDTHELEKQRGITIFSKQARLTPGGMPVTLLDTPGHVDFSPETERTLQVLDYAVLVISGSDGVQGHVLTLWQLLASYDIPVFIFVNKMDQSGCDKAALLSELKKTLSDSCMDFSACGEAFYENAATASEEALEQYLESGIISDEIITEAIACRHIFPCFFGSALKLTGIDEFLSALCRYMKPGQYPEQFGARVFKISRDNKGERLTHLKVTGGTLHAKAVISDGEKVNQIRIYDGSSFEITDEVCAGTVCAVTGPALLLAGDGLGYEKGRPAARLVPVLTYQVILPEGCDIHRAFSDLRKLEEEEPQLHVRINERTDEISVRVMGQVQLEILKSLLKERSDLEVSFGSGSIIYKETISSPAEGVGHFEPLRHYAEVHLLLEPAERGSGMVFASDVREDDLDRNWQRLILTHLAQKTHVGILTGSALTDMKITLKAGRAHIKHTEGGDFRQAAYRAVRQGLMQAENILLEPYYSFRLEIPGETAGRAINDIQRMSGSFDQEQSLCDMTILTGRAPVSCMREYSKEVISYTRGRGRLFLEFSGYDICHNTDEVIAEYAYDADRDTENPSSSVFCSHGAGYIVPWNEVAGHMHLPSILKKEQEPEEIPEKMPAEAAASKSRGFGDKELKEIFERTYGSGSFSRSSAEHIYLGEKRNSYEKPQAQGSAARSAEQKKEYALAEPKDKYLYVDGYNIIFAWDDLRSLAKINIDSARDCLMDIMSNYQGYKGINLILVFDAYRVKKNTGRSFKYNNIDVVFTKEGESADQYIERSAARLEKKYDVTVATSDRLEQMSVFSHGARRMSARELFAEIEDISEEIRRKYLEKTSQVKNRPFEDL